MSTTINLKKSSSKSTIIHSTCNDHQNTVTKSYSHMPLVTGNTIIPPLKIAKSDKEPVRIEYLNELHKQICDFLKTSPEGHLKICRSKSNRIQYYVRKIDDSDYVYLRHDQNELATAIAQRDYYLKMKKAVEAEIASIKSGKLLDSSFITADEMYDHLSEERQKLVTPLTVTSSMFRKQWQAVEYVHKQEYEESTIFTTTRGENVRSKSEYMIAEALNKYDIPYRYEYPVRIGRILFHPDFMILRMRDKKEVLWEHLGMIDNPEYSKDAVSRISEFNKGGYVLGDNLLISMETSNTPLTPTAIYSLIEHNLL